MADYILGVPLTSKGFQDESDRFNSYRRNILHFYPNGQASLTGVLALIGEEPVNDSIFYWFEDRYELPKSLARATGTNTAITTDAPSSATATDGTLVTNGTSVTTGTNLFIKVQGTQHFRDGYIISAGTVGTGAEFQAIVVDVTRNTTIDTSGYIEVEPMRAGDFNTGTSDYKITDLQNNDTIQVLGVAIGEGAAGTGIDPLPFKRPSQLQNTTQISRTPMKFSGSVLKMGLKYDRSGPYVEEAKRKEIEHMTQLERNLIFGQRSTTTRTSLDGTGNTESVRTSSGIIEYLRLWDAGSTGFAVDGSTYAPYSGHAAVTLDTDDDKRIIENTAGTFSVTQFHTWLERVSRFHSPVTTERLALCGSGAIQALAEMFRRNSSFNVEYNNEAYGLRFTTLSSPFGIVHFMIHPMFNTRADWRFWMLILDVHSIKYRPLIDRDTRLLKNRQNPGDDFRKDEFLTEVGLEFWQPEANILIKNLQTYVES